MKKICVYLGANNGNDVIYKNATLQLAEEIVNLDFTLVYGGSSVGLMGILAHRVKQLNGRVIGIIPKILIEKEKPPQNLDELYLVNSMQERKIMLQNKADLFLVMPGGLGTLEEAMETLNAIKMGVFFKKIGFLNLHHYFDKLFEFLDDCYKNGFMPQYKTLGVEVSDDVSSLLKRCQ